MEEEKKNEIKTIKSKNYLKDIDETKMILHEGFCLRNNVLCSICKEPITKDKLDEHMEEHKKEKEQKEKLQKIIEENKKKKLEEERKKIEEEKKRIEEENRMKKIEEENKRKKIEEEKKKLEEENKRKKIEEEKKKNNNNSKNTLKQSKNMKKKHSNKKDTQNNSKNQQPKKPNLVAIGYNPDSNPYDNIMNSLKNSHNKKTNLASLDYNLNSNNNQINYADNININNEDDGMIIGDFYKKYGDKLPIKKREVHRTPVPRQPVKIDKSLGCKLCEYCSNYVDNIYKHYSEC
jgi:hypothetical protein